MSVSKASIELLVQCFEIKDGRVHWKARPRGHYLSDKSFNIARSRFFGKPFGCKKVLHNRTYIAGNLSYLGEKFQMYEHTVVWCLTYGKYPTFELDHIDRDGTNNIVENLRDVDHITNLKNRGKNSNNKSGVKGVHFDTSRCKWAAYGKSGGKSVCLGLYDSLCEAASVRKVWEVDNSISHE